MTRPSQPPPGFRPPAGIDGGFVAPTPVYGVLQQGGTLRPARTVAEGAAAARARLAANAELQGAAGWRRTGAALVDLALGTAIAVGVDARSPLPIAALIGVALGATFLIRILVAAFTGGASPGRVLLGTRAVNQDGSALTLSGLATREGFVLFSVVAFPWWGELLKERYLWSWFLKADIGSIRTASVPQDRSTGTSVATTGEIARVRARTAREAQAEAARPAPPAPRVAAPNAAPRASASSASSTAHRPAPAVGEPRLAAAPFIPAEVDPEVAAARAGVRERAAQGGIAVHTMDRPEMPRRMIATIIDYALIVSLSGLLIGAASPDANALIAAAHGTIDPSIAGAIPITLVAWFLVRPFAIFAFTQTPGHLLMHYRVYAPRGRRVGLGKALLRESAGWGTLIAWAWLFGRGGGFSTPAHMVNADLLEEDPMQPRLSHDIVADTWPVRI